MDHPRRSGSDLRRPATAVAFALITPAGLFFLAVVGRSFRPVEHEPAPTLSQIAQAFLALPAAVGVLVIAVAPAAALVLAATVIWRTFVSDPTLTADIARLARARRRSSVGQPSWSPSSSLLPPWP